jgi:hypothetical protein
MKRPIGSGPTLSSSVALTNRASVRKTRKAHTRLAHRIVNSRLHAGSLALTVGLLSRRRREPWRWTGSCWEAAGDDVRRPTGEARVSRSAVREARARHRQAWRRRSPLPGSCPGADDGERDGSSDHRLRRPCWHAAITSALRVTSDTLGSIATRRRTGCGGARRGDRNEPFATGT